MKLYQAVQYHSISKLKVLVVAPDEERARAIAGKAFSEEAERVNKAQYAIRTGSSPFITDEMRRATKLELVSPIDAHVGSIEMLIEDLSNETSSLVWGEDDG